METPVIADRQASPRSHSGDRTQSGRTQSGRAHCVRCAIYTRKSTEDGLEQDFNSLDAQREACSAFIKSQKHEGWSMIRETFEDGGISGGTMGRPGLQKLLDLVRDRRVDVIVVYKVDRLTRSLSDFARMVELFDKHGVSFVSVTQQFNTTTSMGRLTLNVLLSFAQFEREVTAERIRDKIAASKKKGMWMGGAVPLGYDAIDKALVINDHEADQVRSIFKLYLDLGTVGALKAELDRRGWRTKKRTGVIDRMVGGRPFSRGHLYSLLANPIYFGKVIHKGEAYEGQHDAIIDDQLWQAVQDRLKAQATARRHRTNASTPSLLTGLLFDDTGDRLTPSHAVNHGRRYRYYISHRLLQHPDTHPDAWRLATYDIERAVCDALIAVLKDQRQLAEILGGDHNLALHRPKAKARTADAVDALSAGSGDAARRVIESVIDRIEVSGTTLAIDINTRGLAIELLDNEKASASDTAHRLTIPVRLKRRGVERKIVLLDPISQQEIDQRRNPDPQLCLTIARAHRWMKMLTDGTAQTIRDLARQDAIAENEISRRLHLAFLAPDIVDAILDGRQPIDLTVQTLIRQSDFPTDWDTQRDWLGLPPKS